MRADRFLWFARRFASVLIALCFVLPLSQCDADKNPQGVVQRTAGHGLMEDAARFVSTGETVKGLVVGTMTVFVFFFPLLIWKVQEAAQSAMHLLAAPFAACIIYAWLFVFATRPLFGGVLLASCWTVLLLAGGVTLIQPILGNRRGAPKADASGKRATPGKLQFSDVYVCRPERFSIGIEETSGRLYLSIPVSNQLVDYEEYYEINRSQFDLYQADLQAALVFVEACRRREHDDLLILKPGASRGVPS